MNLLKFVTVLTTVKETGHGFQDLPMVFWDQSLFSTDFHRSLVKFHWSAAQHVQYCLDTDLCVNMLHQDVRARALIPDHLQYAVLSLVYEHPSDLSVDLINANPADVRYIPETPLALTLMKCFVKDPYNVATIMQALTADRRTYDICLNAIKYCGYQIWTVMQLVPEQHRTRELCRAFVKAEADGSHLEDLPQDLHTENLIYELALAGQARLDQVPEHLRDQALYEALGLGD